VLIADFLEPMGQVVGTRLDGIVGYNFLKEFAVTLDYPSERLRLYPGTLAPAYPSR
jgi:hypothetical protein